jgi:hypothetical protein
MQRERVAGEVAEQPVEDATRKPNLRAVNGRGQAHEGKITSLGADASPKVEGGQ